MGENEKGRCSADRNLREERGDLEEARFHLSQLEKMAAERVEELYRAKGRAMDTLAPRPWVEASIEEKLERTREAVKQDRSQLQYIYGRLSELQQQLGRLLSHDHLGGRVVVPAFEAPKFDCGSAGQQIAARDLDPSQVIF